jgi:hypothetical protein
MMRTTLHRLTFAGVLAAALAVTLTSGRGSGPAFFPDDPLLVDPETQDASGVRRWRVNDAYDFVENTFLGPGERRDVRALNVNTIDEVPDSSWFVNRMVLRPIDDDDIVRGPLTGDGPADGPWTVIDGKNEGISPGLTIRDSTGQVYFIKFDPPSNPEMATGAEVICTRFFHTLGYHVPENYLAVLRRDQVVIDPKATIVAANGRRRPFGALDLEDVLEKAARRPDGAYRVVASKGLKGTDLGPFRYYGRRPDDPNDIYPHEHRRELRGLRVFAAWLNHDDSRSINTRDFLVEHDGRSIVRHHLLDFGSTLGSGSTQAQKPRAGHEYLWEARPTFVTMMTLGFYVRPWIKVRYPDLPAIGRIEALFFQPEAWKPEYPNPAFDNARPDDEFWAARRVAAFSNDVIERVVRTAEYSDFESASYLTQVLITRRDKIVQTWLNAVLPLADCALAGGALECRNLAVDVRAAQPPTQYQVQWFRFDNPTGTTEPVGDQQVTREPRFAMPPAFRAGVPFAVAEVRATHSHHPRWATPLRLTFRARGAEWQLVGVQRQPAQDRAGVDERGLRASRR